MDIVKGLPEELFIHREWAEYVDVKLEHRPIDGFHISPKINERVRNLIQERADEIQREINEEWDYNRISPEITTIHLSSPENGRERTGRWIGYRIYARAYRYKPMPEWCRNKLERLVSEYIQGDMNLVGAFEQAIHDGLLTADSNVNVRVEVVDLLEAIQGGEWSEPIASEISADGH